MSANSKIEWTDKTWNALRGCSLCSDGCRFCYAMYMAHRFSGPGQPYEGLTRMTEGKPVWTGKIRLVPEALDEPLRWRKPCRVFVNSMSDLFHENVPDDYIDRVWATMLLASQHTFQVLTKRPERMAQYLARAELYDNVLRHADTIRSARCWLGDIGISNPAQQPAKWIWLGVSVENRAALSRIDDLYRTPAAVRFVSFEPLLEDLGNLPLPPKGARFRCSYCGDFTSTPIVSMRAHPWDFKSACGKHDGWCGSFMGDNGKPPIDWAIFGGESGPNARPCNIDWIRSGVRQCRAAGVKTFVKQLGAQPIEPYNELGRHMMLRDRKGGDPAEWPEDLRVREFPDA